MTEIPRNNEAVLERIRVINRLKKLGIGLGGVAGEIVAKAVTNISAGFGENTVPTGVLKKREDDDPGATRPVIKG